MKVYRLSRRAAQDIREIYKEGARLFGEEQAGRYHAHLASVFALIGKNPRIARERPELSPPIRVHPCVPIWFCIAKSLLAL